MNKQRITWLRTRGFVRLTGAGAIKEFPTFSAALDWAKEQSGKKPNTQYFVGGEGVRPGCEKYQGRIVNYRGRYVRAGKATKKRWPGV